MNESLEFPSGSFSVWKLCHDNDYWYIKMILCLHEYLLKTVSSVSDFIYVPETACESISHIVFT
jgi:hypothetical protein